MNITSKKLAPLLEYAINRYLQADPPLAKASLKLMSDKVVGVSFTTPQLEFFLLIKADTIQVCAEHQGQTDTWIRGSLFDLLRFGLAVDDNQQTVHLEIVGDVQLGQRLQQLFVEIEFDWEELLTPLMGDIATHQLSEGLRAAGSFVDHCIESLSFSSGEFLQEELKITPTRQEIDYFIDNVEKLRDTVARLDARIQRMEKR